MLDPRLVEQIASTLGTRPEMVEKDWQVVRALRVLIGLQHGQVRPIFSGGTSLSLGWGLIKRFSEDIDFKVIMPAAATRAQRRTYREAAVAAMIARDFQLIGDVRVRDESRFFNADFRYPSQFDVGQGLRPHLRLEMSLEPPALESIARPIHHSFRAARGKRPRSQNFRALIRSKRPLTNSAPSPGASAFASVAANTTSRRLPDIFTILPRLSSA